MAVGLVIGAVLLAACGDGGDDGVSGLSAVTVSDDEATGADGETPPADVELDERPDLIELRAEVLASWEPDDGQVWSLTVTDEMALVVLQQGFESTVAAIDLTTGETMSVAQTTWVSQFARTATNGVFLFDQDECTFRRLDLDTLELGDGFGKLSTDGCSGGSDSSIVRGDVIWNEQRGVTQVIDTTTGEVRSLLATEVSDRLADVASHAFLDLGDAVMIIYFDNDVTLATRVDDDLAFGPLVEVPRRPYFDNGVLVDDSTDDEGFSDVVVLDPITLEITDADRPPVPRFGTVSCDPVDALRASPAPDGSIWVGPLAVDDDIVVTRCRDGVEIGRGVIDHDQFRLVDTSSDAFFYVAAVFDEPDEDGFPSFQAIAEVLVRVSAASSP